MGKRVFVLHTERELKPEAAEGLALRYQKKLQAAGIDAEVLVVPAGDVLQEITEPPAPQAVGPEEAALAAGEA